MKYILSQDYRLRGWKGEPFFLECFSQRRLTRLKLEEFLFLLKCDGRTELDPATFSVPEWMLKKGVYLPYTDGRSLLPEQEYRLFSNRRFYHVELSVTGRCNFRCKHCFNAAGTKPRTVEPSLEQLADMEACFRGFTIDISKALNA